MSPVSTRRSFSTADRRTIQAHYSTTPAAQLAKLLGRTELSLYQFVKRNRELLKRPRL
ncbi:hypothetical protein [Hymenobacter pini]|uniref:hypothetical protein n=1 Tax=Hymenobacter pini TaxID=2880879 RepID=UPI001CF30D0C|nr:hypothetical protein [Hymenobacter pini]MCA8829418.1 hypothetical protein [Hymenobacter pini]